jgi:hypothetical protein
MLGFYLIGDSKLLNHYDPQCHPILRSRRLKNLLHVSGSATYGWREGTMVIECLQAHLAAPFWVNLILPAIVVVGFPAAVLACIRVRFWLM